jgi:hypothetical protein
MSALVLWMNIPPMVLIFGLMVGIPLWMVLRRPDRHPAETRTAPAYIVQQRREATDQRQGPSRDRHLVTSGAKS